LWFDLTMPDLKEADRRDKAHELTELYHVHLNRTVALLGEQKNNAVHDYEQNRKMFMDMILMIQKQSEFILKMMKEKGLMTLDFDKVKNKSIMKARTTVVAELVTFLNTLNDEVIRFYKDVYKVKEEQERPNQIRLF